MEKLNLKGACVCDTSFCLPYIERHRLGLANTGICAISINNTNRSCS